MSQGSSSVSSRRSDLAFVFDLWSFPRDVLGPTKDRGSYFAIDYHPKIILRLDLGCRRRCPLTSCQITAAEAFPWCQLDMGRVQHFAIWPSRFQKYYWDSFKNVACGIYCSNYKRSNSICWTLFGLWVLSNILFMK